MNDSKENHSIGSYVEPRVPSITGFGQRKVYGKPTKVLKYSLDQSNDNSDNLKIDVCLRLKPRVNDLPSSGLDTLTIVNDTTVACVNGNQREDITEYTFSSVFGPTIDQKQFFDSWVYAKVLRFLNGNSELLFVYGTTNAGKTYTIHGNVNDPGIIPRTLLLVFNLINNKLMPHCKYKPDKVIAGHILDENLMKAEEFNRKNILNNWCYEKSQDDLKSCVSQLDEGHTVHNIDQLNNNDITKMFDSLKNDSEVSLDHGNVRYSVWVSYAEIYNETIYDLLVTYSANQKRVPLKLSLDQNKNVYVKDLNCVFVQSAEEAYKVLCFGRHNLKIASNNLNKLSSRSHCIFTLKLMRIENVENPSSAVISSISFCDLAGSERLKKTMNVGDRLMESKNINTSLLVLNKCFSVLRENQKSGENYLIPYRESKLTQIFQTALTASNKTGISMAVNVDMSPALLEETKQVLSMSAVVRSITRKPKPRPSFVIWASNNTKTKQAISEPSLVEENEENNDESGFGKDSMISYKEHELILQEEKTKLRTELLSKFKSMLKSNEEFHINQKEKMLKTKTEVYESKIQRLKAYYLEEIRERDEKLKNLKLNSELLNNFEKNKSEMENFEFRIGELANQNEELLAEINRIKNVKTMQEEEMITKNQEIESFKSMLIEANTAYKQSEKCLNEITDELDKYCNEVEEKDLEIEVLTASLEAKDKIIQDLEDEQEELVTEAAEQRILQYMDEKLEIIYNLEIANEMLQVKMNRCKVAKTNILTQYQHLKQQYSDLSKEHDLLDGSNTSKLEELQTRIKQLECELSEKNSVKSKTKSTAVLTNLNNVNLPLQLVTESEEKENKIIKSENLLLKKYKTKTPRSVSKKMMSSKTADSPNTFDKILDEAIDHIPISTRKRKLFDNKPPLSDNVNKPSNNVMDLIVSPTRALLQVSKLRVKK